MPRERSAGAVVFYIQEKTPIYLLLHYKSGHHDFPKGNIEENEEEIETVRREIREETGIEDIDFMDGFREEINYFYRRSGRTIFKTVVFYLARSNTRGIKLSYEHIGYRWLEYQEAVEKVTFKNSKDILKKANDYLKSRGISS